MTIADTLIPTSSPIEIWNDGSVRVIGSRITLHTMVSIFDQGYTPEMAISSFPSLSLDKVNAVFQYIADNRSVVDEYMERYEIEAKEIRKKIEAQFPTRGLKEKLLARKALLEQASK